MRLTRTFALIVVGATALFLLAPSIGARAQPTQGPTAQTVLENMFRAKTVDATAFADSFTSQVPVATLQSLIDGYRARLGSLSTVSAAGADYLLTFEKGSLRATIVLDSQGKVSGLRFHDEVSAANLAALQRVLAADHVSADWFSPSFLTQVPAAQLDTIMSGLRAQEGKFLRVDQRDGVYYSVFEKGENPTQIALDEQGRIVVLFLGPLVAKATSLNDALQRVRSGPSLVAYLILEGRTEVAALDADRPMAVGSAFKLAVLAALRAQIERKERSWSDIVPLDPANKSLPSGTYQKWPDSTPITLQTYATQMISISDNTAADTLVRVVGQPALEHISPRNSPFLTTREMFVLKSKNPSLRNEYRKATVDQRRAILARIDAGPAPSLEDLDLSPSYVDIEWDFTSRELCRLMERVEDLPLMTVNPGFPPGSWKRVAFKGGSDSGALNLTSYLTSADGKSYCVTATWNDAAHAIDETAAEAAYSAVLDQLSRR